MTPHRSERKPKGLKLFFDKYVQALGQGLWFFLLLLVLQMSINTLFILHSYSLLPEGESLIAEVSMYGSFARSLLRVLFWSSLGWWLYALLSLNKVSRAIARVAVLLIAVGVFVLEGFIFMRYGMVYCHSVVQILSGTNPREAQEYFESAFDFTLLLPILFGLVLLIVAISRYESWAKRKSFRWVLVLFCLLIPPFLVVSFYSTPRTYDKVHSTGQAYDLTIAPYDRLLWNTYGFIRESRAIANVSSRIAQIDVGEITRTAYVAAPSQNKLNIVVVVGETLRRDYMHCYGFPLPNTPGIDSLLSTGDMIAYTDAVSPAPNTIESLTKVFTYQTNDMPGKWYEYPTLPSIFSRAGYWVEWVSNQESTGTFIQPLNTFAKLSDGHSYVNARSIDEEHDATKHFYDEDVIPHLKTVAIAEQNEKQGLLQIVHLMGSHPVYEKRFPKSFERFKITDLPVRRTEEQDDIVADYINSVYYNDYVVTNIVKQYADKPSIVIYFSDHGEVIYDDPDDPSYCDHGMIPVGVNVPFLVYLSPMVRADYPDLYDRINKYKTRPIMLDLFTHSLAGLFGINNKFSNSELDFFSDQYRETRPRVIRSFGKELRL